MNDLLLEKIRGTKIAIICYNQLQWDIVSLICNQSWGEQKAFNHDSENCIGFQSDLLRSEIERNTLEYFNEERFTIFTAIEFIKQNLGILPNTLNVDAIIEKLNGAMIVIEKQDMGDMQWNSVDGWVRSALSEAKKIKSADDLWSFTKGVIYPGLKFRSKYFTSPAEILSGNIPKNTLEVKIGNNTEPDWDLQHTIWGFERGDYYID